MYDKYKLYKTIMCIDIKAFYASVEANERGLDIFKDYLVVADPARGDKAITLAITPALKAQGIASRSRIFDIPNKLMKKSIIAKPQMKKYLNISSSLYSFYTKYFDKNDIFVYSIDEVFIDTSKYLSYYKTDSFKLAFALKKKIYDEFKLHVCVGIGQNMVMAKYALDIESKKTKYEIANWNYELIPEKLWKINDLSSVWGIGKQTAKKLYSIGIFNMGDLANYDLELLYKDFGILAIDLSMHANGVDPSILQNKIQRRENQKTIGQSQVLFSDYNYKDVEIVILEMVLEVILKLNGSGKVASGIQIYIGESKRSPVKGFNIRKTLDFEFDTYFEIKDYFLKLYRDNVSNAILIKRLSVSVFNLSTHSEKQINLFNNNKKTNNLDKALNDVKKKFGKSSISLALSVTNEGTQKERDKLIGGHNAEILNNDNKK